MASQNDTYTATGTEGTIITRLALLNQVILLLYKGNAPLQQVTTAPTPSQFMFNSVTAQITFGSSLNANNVIQTIYRSV